MKKGTRSAGLSSPPNNKRGHTEQTCGSSASTPKKLKNMVLKMQPPIKSINDRREYRVLQLNNGLRALLISDLINEAGKKVNSSSDSDSPAATSSPDASPSGDEISPDEDDVHHGQFAARHDHGEKLAAAALCVGVGSFSDPPELPGLAHLLEHMIFMGSTMYPEENSLDSFLTKHGGSDNASTDCEMTVFHFDVQRKVFREALERFASCFISPLLKKEAMMRELESVDSEFQMSLQEDACRKQQLLGLLAKDGHPMQKFLWGNKITLHTVPASRNIDIQAKLKQFHQRYYSAHYMTLAVQAPVPLDTLEDFVVEIFGQIVNNGLPQPDFGHMSNPFNPDSYLKIYKGVPVRKVHQLEITWALPCLRKYYRSKPHHYLSFLIGHEGPGSLMNFLKNKLWALSLWSGNDETGFEHNSSCCLFSIIINLTDEGFNHVFEVITAIFQYVHMIRLVGPVKRIFDEIQTIENSVFRWQEQVDSVDYVELLCENIQVYPSQDYLTGHQLMFEFDELVIRECLYMLVPEKSIILLLSKQHEGNDICDRKEPFFQMPYGVYNINMEWIMTWKNIKPNPTFHIPPENKFIACDFRIRPPDMESIASHPIKILNTSQSRLWYKKDKKFLVPKSYIYFHLITPLVNKTPQSLVLFDLFMNILEHNLKESTYAAEVAQLSYTFLAVETGMVIKLWGFNDKLYLLFETIVDHIAHFTVTEDIFNVLKNQLHQIYYNSFIKPHKLCKEVRLSLIQQIHWSSIDKRSLVTTTNKEMVLTFAQEFKSSLFLEGLVQGNITVEDALRFEEILWLKLNCSVLPKSAHPESRVILLPLNEYYCRMRSLNYEDSNSVVLNYYQWGPGNIYKWCVLELLVTFMEEPCFDTLRTIEQLGYHVSCLSRNTAGILGFTVMVQTQATKHSVDFIDRRIENFLDEFEDKINEMKKEEFKEQVEAVITLKKCDDLQLADEVSRNWSEILSQTYIFDRLDREIFCLKSISLKELKNWFRSMRKEGDHYRKLSIQVVGAGILEDNSNSKDHGHVKHSSGSLKNRHGSKNSMAKLTGYLARVRELRLDQLKGHQKDLYEYEFLPLDDDDDKEDFSIMDINKFKQRQSVYPVSKLLP